MKTKRANEDEDEDEANDFFSDPFMDTWHSQVCWRERTIERVNQFSYINFFHLRTITFNFWWLFIY